MGPPPRFTHSAFESSHYDICLRWYADVAGLRLVKERGDPDGRVVEFSHGQDVAPANWDA